MSEPIYNRIKRLVAANITDTVEKMERAGGAKVMREAIREIERVLEEASSERDKVTAERLQAVRLQGLCKQRLEDLQSKAEYAFDQGREDLAEAALIRQTSFEGQIQELQATEANAADRERQLEEGIATLSMRVEEMQEELKAFEEVHAASNSVAAPQGKEKANDQRVKRAEAAFDRVFEGMQKAFGITRTDADTLQKLSEIDGMQKQDVISQKMEALRARKAQAGAPLTAEL